MEHTIIKNIQDYRKYLIEIIGDSQSENTYEELCAQITFNGSEQMNFSLPVDFEDYLNRTWAVMISQDGYALAPSVNDLIQLDFYKKQGYGWFDGVTAKDYGRAFFSQLPTVIKLLQKNPATRQAVIRLPGDTCLESVQFLWREIIMDGVIVNVLLCIANFRSIDAVKGLPLDLEILRRLASYVSTMLSDLVLFDQAPITINAGSFHIYFDDIEMV